MQVESAGETPLTYECAEAKDAATARAAVLFEVRIAGTKQVSPGYALVSAKGVSQGDAGVSTHRVSVWPGWCYITQHEVGGTNIDMGALAGMLASPVGRPVQDQTGLQGKYTVKVQFAPAGDAESTQPSIFTALKEQVGLELKPAQVPVQTLTIEHLNLTPTEN